MLFSAESLLHPMINMNLLKLHSFERYLEMVIIKTVVPGKQAQ